MQLVPAGRWLDALPATHGDLDQQGEVLTALQASLVRHAVPAIGFANESKLFVPGETDARTALLERWLDAGLELGNHTLSHVPIDQVPFERYKEDLIRGETVTCVLLRGRGKSLKYFRHPSSAPARRPSTGDS